MDSHQSVSENKSSEFGLLGMECRKVLCFCFPTCKRIVLVSSSARSAKVGNVSLVGLVSTQFYLEKHMDALVRAGSM